MPLMPLETIFVRITPHQAEVLARLLIAGGIGEAADHLTLSPETVRSHLRKVREITETENTSQLMLWWRDHRGQWLAHLAIRAGIPPDEVPTWQVPSRW